MTGTDFRKIRLYSVPLNHRGITGRLLSEAIKHIQWPDYSGMMYIAPTPRKIRDAQKKFHELVKNPYIPPAFFTLKQISKHFFDIKLPGRWLPRLLTPLLISGISGRGIGYSSILSDLMKELKQRHPSKGMPLIHQELTEIFRKLGIPDDALKRLSEAMEIFEKYQAAVSGADFYDDEDILSYSSSVAARLLDRFPVLIADGFCDMTTSEENLFGELARKAESTLISVPRDGGLSAVSDGLVDYLSSNFDLAEEYLEENSLTDLSYIKYNGMEEEIESIARHIKNLYITGHMKTEDSVIVTFPASQDYPELAERVFSRYGLPATVSLNRPPSRRSAQRDVLYLLESVAEDFPRSKFTTVLMSSSFKNIPETLRRRIPSLSLKSGIIKGKEAWENFSSSIEDKSLAESMKDGIARIFRTLGGLIDIKAAASIEVFHEETKKVLTELGFDTSQDDADILEHALQVVGIISELPGEKTISLGRYTEFLRYVLSASEYRREEEGIQIMDFSETEGLEPDYLYFCGLKDGVMPSKPRIDHILPDSVRTEYRLINMNKHLAAQKLNFLRITGSSTNTHLSYPAVDGDKLFLPSSYLPWGRDVQESVFGVFCLEELQTRNGTEMLSDSIKEIHLDKATKERLLGRELSMPMRVTDIDYYKKCPRRFFVEKILNIEPPGITEYEVEAKLLGTLIHRIMEKLLDGGPIESTLEARQKASSIINDIIRDYTIDNYWKKLIKEVFLEILPKIVELESQFAKEGFIPYKLELKTEEEVLPGVMLKGKIDRLDRGDDAFRLIDYKTGSVKIGSAIIKKGKDLQLPLYAAMLKSSGMDIEKAGIYSLKEISINWIPTKRDKNTLDEYISSTLEYLKEIIMDIREGSFSALPLEEFFCSNCAESPFCPYINSKNGGRDEQLS